MSNAYWISPSGKIIEVGTRHIVSVLTEPQKFGLKKPDLEKIYKKYKEPLGLEGHARDEIMTALMQKGWIRVRNAGNSGWYLQTWNLTGAQKNYIYDFIAHGMKHGFINKYTPIEVESLQNHRSDISSSPASEVVEKLFEYKKSHQIKLKDLLEQTKREKR